MLAKRMSDPRFMQAITEFQTNPQEAMVKYGNDKEIQLFLKEFCGLLGANLFIINCIIMSVCMIMSFAKLNFSHLKIITSNKLH